jgi:hypothetical protein
MDTEKLVYLSLDGEKLNLSELNAEHKDLVKEFYKMYRETHYVAFNNVVWEADCMKKMGAKEWSDYDSKKYATRYYIDKELSRTPIYRLVRDLLDRKGIQEGFIGLDESCKIMDFSGNKKVLEDFLK